MERWYRFNDVLDKNGDVAKEKIPDCTFAHLRPGDYVGISFNSRDEDNSYHHGSVFAKVESVTMPKAAGFFSGNPGQVKVSFPDGSVTDLLVYRRVGTNNWGHDAYSPTKAVYQYFNNNCFPDKGGSVNTVSIEAYPADRKALLKERMQWEFARRKNRKEQILLEQQKRREKELERERQEQLRREEQQRRNAAVSSEDLDNLFYNG